MMLSDICLSDVVQGLSCAYRGIKVGFIMVQTQKQFDQMPFLPPTDIFIIAIKIADHILSTSLTT